jgi:TolB protein
VKGYDGEVARVLKFDLEVMGCKIVPEGDSAYLLAGGNLNSVNGILKDAAGNFRFNKRYNGGNLRQQAHALSNDVIKAITGRNGIAQTRILYKMKTGPRAYEVFVSDYDGHRPVALTADNTLTESPLWAPGNGEVFYTSWMKIGGVENTTVIRHKMKTGKRTVFSRFKGLNTGGDLSPQGMVAMVLSRGINPDVWVAPMGWEFLKDIKGKQLKQMCRTREAESGPAWSPDGKWLCFATRANGRRMLVKVAATGGNMIKIPTPGAINPTDPAWSPDGKSIAFTSQAGKFFNIFVAPATGGKADLITSGEGPSWARNNRNLIFTRRGVNKRMLAIVDVPTKQVKMLPAFSGSASQPDWQK